MLFFGDSGPPARLYITLDKSAYVAGEIVRGRVALTVMRDIVADGLSVRIRGREHISWTELVTKQVSDKEGSHTHTERVTRSRSNAFLDDHIPLFLFPRALARGNYEFLFAYHAHASLPGAFTFVPIASCDSGSSGCWNSTSKKDRRDLNASIAYSVDATLDDGRWFFCSWSPRARTDVALHALPHYAIASSRSDNDPYATATRNAPGGSTYESTQQCVRLLSILNQGTCEVAVSLSQSAYAAGTTLTLEYRINNTSRVDIRMARVTLLQDVTFQRHAHRASTVITTCVSTIACAGVLSQTSIDSVVTLALVNAVDGRDLAPTTAGALVRCSYRLRLQCDIAWTPDVCLELPVVVAAPIAVAAATAPLATPVSVDVGVPVGVAVAVAEPSDPTKHTSVDLTMATAIPIASATPFEQSIAVDGVDASDFADSDDRNTMSSNATTPQVGSQFTTRWR